MGCGTMIQSEQIVALIKRVTMTSPEVLALLVELNDLLFVSTCVLST